MVAWTAREEGGGAGEDEEEAEAGAPVKVLRVAIGPRNRTSCTNAWWTTLSADNTFMEGTRQPAIQGRGAAENFSAFVGVSLRGAIGPSPSVPRTHRRIKR